MRQNSDNHLNHVKWAGWGVINIDSGSHDRQQRRNYLNKVHAEITPRGYVLHPGGTTTKPWYRVIYTVEGMPKSNRVHIVAGNDAFQKICAWLLQDMGEVQELNGDQADEHRVGALP